MQQSQFKRNEKREQYYDNNNNNSNNNGAKHRSVSRVRLLISPATDSSGNSDRGNEQRQFSNRLTGEQQKRGSESQQQQQQQQPNDQHRKLASGKLMARSTDRPTQAASDSTATMTTTTKRITSTSSSRVSMSRRSSGGKIMRQAKAQTAASQANSVPMHQNRSQNSSLIQANRPKNYHHYDYYTDSDLTPSSGGPPVGLTSSTLSQAANGGYALGNHSDDNISLFAVEHDNDNGNHRAPPPPPQNSISNSPSHYSAARGKSSLARSKLNGHSNGNGAANLSAQHQVVMVPVLNGSGGINRSTNQPKRASPPPLQQQQHHYQIYQPATGKFVKHYPSWRQSQSPTGHYQNYAFHVPSVRSHQNSALSKGARRKQQVAAAPQSSPTTNGSYLAPSETQRRLMTQQQSTSRNRATSGGDRRSSFKSRTIAHLPGMVKSATDHELTAACGAGYRNTGSDHVTRVYEDFIGDDECQQNDSPTSQNLHERRASRLSNRQYIQSEGNLLRAHYVRLENNDEDVENPDCYGRRRGEYGYDNPFKPGTQLSWEADLMVRLIKRGYPIDELPILVETAKQVKASGIYGSTGRSRSESQMTTTVELAETQQQQQQKHRHAGDRSSAIKSSGQPVDAKKTYTLPREKTNLDDGHGSGYNLPLASETEGRLKGASNVDLSSGKRIWAQSLKRTKSMPRVGVSNYDADSIDKLIFSIESEMSQLLNSNDDDDSHECDEDSTRPLVASGGARKSTSGLEKTAKKSADSGKVKVDKRQGSGKNGKKSSPGKTTTTTTPTTKSLMRTRQKQGTKTTAESETRSNQVTKKKAPKCCVIQ